MAMCTSIGCRNAGNKDHAECGICINRRVKMSKQCKVTACYTEIVDDRGYCVEHKNYGVTARDTSLTDSVFVKNDKAKPRLELLDPDFMTGVAQVLTFGAVKYSAYNWQKADEEGRERIKGALLRHQLAYMNGEIVDPETGLNHMYHVGCNAMFLAYFDRHLKEHKGQGHFDLCDGMNGYSIKAEDIK